MRIGHWLLILLPLLVLVLGGWSWFLFGCVVWAIVAMVSISLERRL